MAESQGLEDEGDEDELMPAWMRAGATTVISSTTAKIRAFQLDQGILKALDHMGFDHFFPVQRAVIPTVLETDHTTASGDICVCAPTGSGKTLAYAIPIVQLLQPRILPRLRALVLLPTRTLALQVHRVFQQLTQHTDLRVVLAIGEESFNTEHRAIVGEDGAAADVLVATPGRLVDHLQEGCTLQHLQWLVVDEADRLLSQQYSQWLQKVLQAAHAPPPTPLLLACHDAAGKQPAVVPYGWRPKQPLKAARGLIQPQLGMGAASSPPLRKLLFSATLTRNPQKLAALKLHQPRYLRVGSSRYGTPEGLQEHMVVCEDAAHKPLVLLLLLQHLQSLATQPAGGSTLVFTSSVQATHRLVRLLQLLGVQAAEFSSNLDGDARQAVLRGLGRGRYSLVVTSDAMTRGMDVETISCVINYDAPAFIKTYIHRVGRTARAGKAGSCYTVLQPEQAHHFKKMIAKAEKTVGKVKLPQQQQQVEAWLPRYEEGLAMLKEVLHREQLGSLSSQAPLDRSVLAQLSALHSNMEEEAEEADGEEGEGDAYEVDEWGSTLEDKVNEGEHSDDANDDEDKEEDTGEDDEVEGGEEEGEDAEEEEEDIEQQAPTKRNLAHTDQAQLHRSSKLQKTNKAAVHNGARDPRITVDPDMHAVLKAQLLKAIN